MNTFKCKCVVLQLARCLTSRPVFYISPERLHPVCYATLHPLHLLHPLYPDCTGLHNLVFTFSVPFSRRFPFQLEQRCKRAGRKLAQNTCIFQMPARNHLHSKHTHCAHGRQTRRNSRLIACKQNTAGGKHSAGRWDKLAALQKVFPPL